MKTISVIGSGYVGVTTAVIAANCGYKVYLIDIDREKIKIIKTGKSFFYEEGIDSLIQTAISNDCLLPTTEYSQAIANSELVFSCVGTPDNPDGSSNLNYVFQAAKTASKYLTDGTVYIQKSTVPVGTGAKVKNFLPKSVYYTSNPEFLREGTAIHDTLFFDRIVVGSDNDNVIEKVFELYRAFEKNRDIVARLAGLRTDKTTAIGEYIATNLESAELIKVTANAFLALKISFANSIAKMADKSGADVIGVMNGVGTDKRIGKAFLNAGRGYGGGCFPKDVSGLIGSASELGVDMPIMTAAQDVNESMVGYIANKAKSILGSLTEKNVAVLGLAFKAGTSDARRSPGVKLANLLAKANANVKTYDPQASEEANNELRKDIEICKSIDDAITDCDAIFFATDWDEFKILDFQKVKKSMRGELIFDCMNFLDAKDIQNSTLLYSGVGRY